MFSLSYTTLCHIIFTVNLLVLILYYIYICRCINIHLPLAVLMEGGGLTKAIIVNNDDRGVENVNIV